MNTPRSAHERAYRSLTLLYPAGFRREYADEMAGVFADDVRERGALRAWARTLLDIVLSVPVQHMEAAVTQPSAIRAARVALGLSVLLVLAVIAQGRYVAVGVPVALVLAATALLYLRSQLPYREAVRSAGSGWWRLAAAGAGLLASIGLVANYGPDVDWFPWHLAAFLYLTGWALIIAGGIAGLVRLAGHFGHQPASPL